MILQISHLLNQQICISQELGRSSISTHTLRLTPVHSGWVVSYSVPPGPCHWDCVLIQFSGMKQTCLTTGSWWCCLILEVLSPIPAGYMTIYRFYCGFIWVSLCRGIKIKLTNMYISKDRVQFKMNSHLCNPDGLSVVQCHLGHVIRIVFLTQFQWHETNVLDS